MITILLTCKGYGSGWYKITTPRGTYEASVPDGWTLWGVRFPTGWEPVTVENP